MDKKKPSTGSPNSQNPQDPQTLQLPSRPPNEASDFVSRVIERLTSPPLVPFVIPRYATSRPTESNAPISLSDTHPVSKLTSTPKTPLKLSQPQPSAIPSIPTQSVTPKTPFASLPAPETTAPSQRVYMRITMTPLEPSTLRQTHSSPIIQQTKFSQPPPPPQPPSPPPPPPMLEPPNIQPLVDASPLKLQHKPEQTAKSPPTTAQLNTEPNEISSTTKLDRIVKTTAQAPVEINEILQTVSPPSPTPAVRQKTASQPKPEATASNKSNKVFMRIKMTDSELKISQETVSSTPVPQLTTIPKPEPTLAQFSDTIEEPPMTIEPELEPTTIQPIVKEPSLIVPEQVTDPTPVPPATLELSTIRLNAELMSAILQAKPEPTIIQTKPEPTIIQKKPEPTIIHKKSEPTLTRLSDTVEEPPLIIPPKWEPTTKEIPMKIKPDLTPMQKRESTNFIPCLIVDSVPEPKTIEAKSSSIPEPTPISPPPPLDLKITCPQSSEFSCSGSLQLFESVIKREEEMYTIIQQVTDMLDHNQEAINKITQNQINQGLQSLEQDIDSEAQAIDLLAKVALRGEQLAHCLKNIKTRVTKIDSKIKDLQNKRKGSQMRMNSSHSQKINTKTFHLQKTNEPCSEESNKIVNQGLYKTLIEEETALIAKMKELEKRMDDLEKNVFGSKLDKSGKNSRDNIKK